jgi:hypothetical protein
MNIRTEKTMEGESLKRNGPTKAYPQIDDDNDDDDDQCEE